MSVTFFCAHFLPKWSVVLTLLRGVFRMVDLVRGVWWEACADTVFAAAAIVGCKKAVIVPSCCKNAVIVGCKKAAAPILAIHQGSGHCR